MTSSFNKGYFGIGVYHSKTEANIGTLWRSAHNFGASFIFTIGRRYNKQCTDTTKAILSIPLYNYKNYADFEEHIPYSCPVVAIEQTENARNLINFCHPPRALYLLGAEDGGLPNHIIQMCHYIIQIPSISCLNVAVAGSIVLYDRISKSNRGILRTSLDK